MRNLTLEGRIIIFKTYGFVKIIYLALLIIPPGYISKELERMQEHFIWKHSRPKIQHKTLRMDYKNDGLEN